MVLGMPGGLGGGGTARGGTPGFAGPGLSGDWNPPPSTNPIPIGRTTPGVGEKGWPGTGGRGQFLDVNPLLTTTRAASEDPPVIVPPRPRKICGPNVTPEALSVAYKVLSGAMSGYDAVKSSGPLNFKGTNVPPVSLHPIGLEAHSYECPTNCPDTVTFCGLCFEESFPGNFTYGFLADFLPAAMLADALVGIRSWAYFGSNYAQFKQDKTLDNAEDKDSIAFGLNARNNFQATNLAMPSIRALKKQATGAAIRRMTSWDRFNVAMSGHLPPSVAQATQAAIAKGLSVYGAQLRREIRRSMCGFLDSEIDAGRLPIGIRDCDPCWM